ncbi:tyrosine-protein phosphatase [Nocardia sp. R16R-3T]
MTTDVPTPTHGATERLVGPAPVQLANVRDIGGLHTDDGRTTASGILIRSDAPFIGDLDPELQPWPPRTVVDLRSPTEIHREHPWAAGPPDYVHIPLLNADPVRMALDREMGHLVGLYTAMLQDGAERIARIARLVAEAPAPVMVHCAVGKDRTGVVVAVLLAAVGVSESEIVRDYRATEANMPGIVARMVLGRPPEERRAMREVAADPSRDVSQAPEHAVVAVLREISAAPGGPAGWLRRAGLSAVGLERLRDRLTVDGRTTHAAVSPA